jgi:hypothetical protein
MKKLILGLITATMAAAQQPIVITATATKTVQVEEQTTGSVTNLVIVDGMVGKGADGQPLLTLATELDGLPVIITATGTNIAPLQAAWMNCPPGSNVLATATNITAVTKALGYAKFRRADQFHQ